MNIAGWISSLLRPQASGGSGLTPYYSGGEFFGDLEFGGVSSGQALKVSVVYACIQILSSTVGALPLKAYEWVDEQPTLIDGRKQPQFKNLQRILGWEANDYQNAFDFRFALMKDLLIHGACYAYILRDGYGRATGMVALDATQVTPRYKNNANILEGIHFQVATMPTMVPFSDMVYLRFCPDADLTKIQSPLRQLGANAFELVLEADKRANKYQKQGVHASGVVSVPSGIDGQGMTAIKNQFIAQNSGAGKAGMPIVLPKDTSYTPMNVQGEDAFINQRVFQIEEVARVYGVPTAMLQSIQKGSFSTVEQQDIAFIKHCLTPHIVRWEQELARKLLVDRETQYIKFNLNALQRGSFKDMTEGIVRSVQGGVTTPNEARHLLELPSIDGADTLFIQQNMAPVTDMNNILGGNKQ